MQLKDIYDIFIDVWLSMKERRKSYEMSSKLKELKKDLRNKIEDIEVDLECEIEKDKVKIGRK